MLVFGIRVRIKVLGIGQMKDKNIESGRRYSSGKSQDDILSSQSLKELLMAMSKRENTNRGVQKEDC